ncbi:MAG: efflux RND transporter periplasmic adaptor subunit [Gammaproteobacteria bacterium]
MKTLLLALLVLVVGVVVGFSASQMNLIGSHRGITETEPENTEREILYWVAPMDPGYRRDEPGRSPMGMALVPVYADQTHRSEGIKIDATVVNNLGVKTVTVSTMSLRPTIKTVGRLEYNDERVSHVHLRASGWIHRLAVRAEGERVSRGALLFDVYSPELVKAQAEYLQTIKSGRTELVAPTRDRLRALGITASQIDAIEDHGKVSQYVHVYAPRGGVVTKLNVADGKFVGPDSDIMVIAELDQLWLISDVFESQADILTTGLPVHAKTAFAESGEIETKIEYIYPNLDPITRTIRVRSVVENVEERLKPGMFMTVSIEGPQRPPTTVVPTSALIRKGFDERVIVAGHSGHYRPAEVSSGIESNGLVEILTGLADDEEVVVSGQFLIDSESSFAGATVRMSPNTIADPDGDVLDHPGVPPHVPGPTRHAHGAQQ